MNCLIDYIGLTGCGVSNPASGLFINSLPGISLKSIEQLADAEQNTYIGVWSDVQLRATKRLQLMLNSALSKEHKVKTAQYSINTFSELDGGNTLSVHYPAFVFESDCFSPIQYHHIDSITIRKANYDDSYTFYLYDCDSVAYKLIATKTVTGNGTTEYESFDLNINASCKKAMLAVQSGYDSFYDDIFTSIYFDGGSIKSGVSTLNSDFIESDLSYGISISYGLRCSLDNIACHSKDLFSLPLWYLLGAELMMERMTSERINKWTVDRKQAEELKAFYDNEAEKALKQAVAGANINDCDCCLECDPPIAVREARL